VIGQRLRTAAFFLPAIVIIIQTVYFWKMEITDIEKKLKQAQFFFWMNLSLTLFAFSIFIKSLNSEVTWKIICSGTGFSLILFLTILLFIRILTLKKNIKVN